MRDSRSVEDIILGDAHLRGMDRLRSHLPDDFCLRTARAMARLLQEKPSPSALIVTGFYVNGAAETDGPPGAYFLYKALRTLGFSAKIVTDEICLPLFEGVCPPDDLIGTAQRIENEEAFRSEILEETHPDLLCAVERCGRTADGTYRNMNGRDISRFTAPLDTLFLGPPKDVLTVGIGDGGNEVGMGLLRDVIHEELSVESSVVPVQYLILSTVSNWGAYGLIRYLEILSGIPCLPDPAEVADWIARSVERGAVDGISGLNVLKVDGFELDRERAVIDSLRHCHLEDSGSCR